MTRARAVRGLAGGLVGGRTIKALQIGGPLAGILPGCEARHASSTSRRSPPRGAWSATAGSSRFDDETDMRGVAKHLLHFGAAESCGKCFPCRIGLRRAHEMFVNGAPVVRERARGAARDARGRQPLRARRRHARAYPQPDRALPRRARTRLIAALRSTAPRSRSPTARPSSSRAHRGGDIPTLCFDQRLAPFGACRVCLVGVEGTPGPIARVHDARARRAWWSTPRDPTARRVANNVVELVLSELPAPPGRAHRARARSRAMLERRRDAALARRGHEVAQDERHPYLALQHELCISCGAACARATRSRARSR